MEPGVAVARRLPPVVSSVQTYYGNQGDGRRAERMATRNRQAFDVVALGALNVDLVVEGGGAEENGFSSAEDSERIGSHRFIRELIARRGETAIPFLGGSAFNTMLIFGQLRLGLRLGIIGVSGAVGDGLHRGHVDTLATVGVEDLTLASFSEAGLCRSETGPNGRELLTSPGANREIARHLGIGRTNPELLDAIAGLRILHVTSLIEDSEQTESSQIAESVADFMSEVRRRNPDVLITVDPGELWVRRVRSSAVARIFRQADVVLLNHQEYQQLVGDDPEVRSSVRLLTSLCPRAGIVILKGLTEVIVQHSSGVTLAAIPRLRGVATVDPTGAGDALAAGVLAALASGRSLVEGCFLGRDLAAIRVSALGDVGHSDLRSKVGELWPGVIEAAPLEGLCGTAAMIESIVGCGSAPG